MIRRLVLLEDELIFSAFSASPREVELLFQSGPRGNLFFVMLEMENTLLFCLYLSIEVGFGGGDGYEQVRVVHWAELTPDTVDTRVIGGLRTDDKVEVRFPEQPGQNFFQALLVQLGGSTRRFHHVGQFDAFCSFTVASTGSSASTSRHALGMCLTMS
jgi:hypothetical protein